MDIGGLVLVEGAIVGVLVALRTVCLRYVDLDLPRPVARRIAIGNRVAPWVGVAAVAAVLIGLGLTVS